MKDRYVKIFDILAARKKIKINLLAELLDVCSVTLRRDLDILEKRGIICRAHGYATLDGADETGRRMAVNHLIKQKIAKAAAQTVEEGETIMLESGSCCAMFAEELAVVEKKVTIITNSVYIANFLSKRNINIILLGGYLQPESQVLVGPMTVKCAETFFFQKYFLGTDGFIPEYGFTSGDVLRAETAAELSKRAKNVFVLTEAAKFIQRGLYNMIQFEKLTGIFTDDGIPMEAEDVLVKNNIKIHKVPSANEKIKWCQFPGQPPFLYREREE